MTDFIAANNGLTPTIGLLTSEGVEETAQRNNLSFADLLVPFNGVQISIKDPSGQQSSIKLACNFRDIKRQGYLLSLTVLPSVLKETVRICSQRSSGDDAWSSGFKEFFHYWLEDATHDFLKSYVCCVFAVSTADADPINTLSNLIQQQNYQQHGSGESANSLSPAHCATPKWFLPQILKYYILVQDVSRDDDEKAKSVFPSMSSTYGQQFCYHLKINSSENSNMPDPWSNLIVDRYRGLENGLEVARREIMTKGTSNPAAATAQELSNLSISSIAVSSDINVGALPMTMENNGPKRAAPSTNFATGVTRGDCLSSEDRERIRNFVEHFVKNVLVPFVEKQLATQNEALLSRRGIGKSFTNMKKWLNVASPQSTPTNVNYTNESSEMQTRRLADLAFLFGLYSYSLQLYQTLKKDFLNDQALLYHAGALEMAALSSYLSSTPEQNLKNYPGTVHGACN
ncbi:Trafficking protein particle complex subunit 8 [Aphelenchoides bicaudatus]|nr:Trafficking protein particle complex subunit 8 [Aphelenchoides bicaudatus]